MALTCTMQCGWILLLISFGALLATKNVLGQSLSCNMEEVKKDCTNCTREFINTMIRKDQHSNCSEAYKKMQSCVHDIVFAECFASLVNRIPALKQGLEILLRLYLQPLTNLDVMFCGKEIEERVNLTTIKSGSFVKMYAPCQQDAYVKGPECGLDFYEAFKANKTDPSLCRKYLQAKECEQDVRRTYCKKDMVPEVDPYDPFCTTTPDVHGTARKHAPWTEPLTIFSTLMVFQLFLV